MQACLSKVKHDLIRYVIFRNLGYQAIKGHIQLEYNYKKFNIKLHTFGIKCLKRKCEGDDKVELFD